MSFNPASSRFHELEVEAADRDSARIAARRARMAERTDRLLDARSRTIGMDYAALEAQIAEKQRAEAARKAAERAEVEETARHMALAKAVEEETRAHRAAAAAAASAALTEQAASRSLRTTGDLEGWRRADDAGMRIREDRDARGLDPDPRLGPGSAQVFDGEDPHKPDRIRLQRAQVAAWAEEAAAERAARAAEAAEAARAAHAALRETVQYAEALEDASAEARRRRAAGVAADNLRAAEARRAMEAAAAAEGRAAEAASLLTTTQRGADKGAGYHFLAGDLSDRVASFSDTRIRVDHYRGLPSEAAHATRAVVEAQMEDKRGAAARKREEAAREHEEQQRIAAQAARLERATAAAKDAAKREALAVLERQVAEAAERKRQEAAERRGVRIGDEFYGRFGTSDR